ncbi:hypothetical protein BANRA_05823 [Klebsiella pneumoniae]|nr:hypothetical protein BANRA_05823 [Klebsiella pneumoniae]
MPRRPPAPSLREQPELCYLASCIYKQRRHDDAAVGANDAHEDHHYTKEGAAGFAPERRRRAWRVAVVVIVRAARAGSTHAPSRPARTEQNAVSPSVGAAPSRPIAAPRAGPPRIATFPITAFSDETRSTESPATWPSLAAHCPARPYRVRRTRHRAPRKRSAQCSRGRQRHRAVGCSPWPRPPPGSMRRARARTDRRTHAPMMVAMTLRPWRPPRPRSLYETGRTMEARGPPPRCRSGRERSPRTASRAGYIDVSAAALRLRRSEVLSLPSRGRRVRR